MCIKQRGNNGAAATAERSTAQPSQKRERKKRAEHSQICLFHSTQNYPETLSTSQWKQSNSGQSLVILSILWPLLDVWRGDVLLILLLQQPRRDKANLCSICSVCSACSVCSVLLVHCAARLSFHSLTYSPTSLPQSRPLAEGAIQTSCFCSSIIPHVTPILFHPRLASVWRVGERHRPRPIIDAATLESAKNCVLLVPDWLILLVYN